MGIRLDDKPPSKWWRSPEAMLAYACFIAGIVGLLLTEPVPGVG